MEKNKEKKGRVWPKVKQQLMTFGVSIGLLAFFVVVNLVVNLMKQNNVTYTILIIAIIVMLYKLARSLMGDWSKNKQEVKEETREGGSEIDGNSLIKHMQNLEREIRQELESCCGLKIYCNYRGVDFFHTFYEDGKGVFVVDEIHLPFINSSRFRIYTDNAEPCLPEGVNVWYGDGLRDDMYYLEHDDNGFRGAYFERDELVEILRMNLPAKKPEVKPTEGIAVCR